MASVAGGPGEGSSISLIGMRTTSMALLGIATLGSPLSAQQSVRPAALSPLASATPGLSTSPEFREAFANWTRPFPPFTIIGNVHHVGSAAGR